MGVLVTDNWLEMIVGLFFFHPCSVDVFVVYVPLVRGGCILCLEVGVFCHVDSDWIS